MKKLGILFALLSFPIFFYAQQYGEIQGRVLDSDGKTTLPGASISLEIAGTLRGDVSDVDGDFKIKPLAAGVYTVTVSYTGHQSQVIEDVVVRPDKITELGDLVLKDITHSIPGAEIYAYEDPLIDADNTGMQTISAKDIERTSEARNVQGFIAKVSTGVSSNAEGTELYFRGARGDANLFIVDGVKIMGQVPSVPASGIGSISVYSGGVPAKYGDFTGGVVIIETKNYFDIYKSQQ